MHLCMHSQRGTGSTPAQGRWWIKGNEMSREVNGQGHTYKAGNSYRTVIRRGDHVITAMGPTAQESRKRAKIKLQKLPNVLKSKSSVRVMRKLQGSLMGILKPGANQPLKLNP